MSRLAELAAEMEVLRSEISELDAVEEPTEEQSARMESILPEWDTKKAEHDKLSERAEKVEAVRSASLKPANRETTDAPNVIVRTNPWDDLDAVNRMSDVGHEIRDRAFAAFEDKASTRGVSDESLEALMGRIENVKGAARHALLFGAPAYREGFEEYMRSQGQNPVFTPEQAYAMRAAMSLTSATGGYGLPTLIDPTLIHVGAATKNPIRNIARVEQGTQNKWNGVTVGNVAVYRKAEGSPFTAGDPAFLGPSVTASMLTAYVTPSFELLEDFASLAAQLPGLIGEAFDFKENTEFITGSGSSAPLGIVTAISGTAGSTVTCTTRGAFTTASAVDIFALVNAVATRYEDNVTWLANKATFNTIRQMPTAANALPIWSDYSAALGMPLLGSPIARASDMATAQTSGTKLIVLGDFSQYVIYDRLGVQVEYIQNVVDTSGLPTGQRGIIAYKRGGANITDVDAFRILNT
jgi:HK97 family phage major capsid protein